MQMTAGEEWRCSNSRCGCEIQVKRSSVEVGQNPVCSCGAPMKKPYTPPVFRYLEFLRLPEGVPVESASAEE